jgi:hypothetical protein
MILDNPEARGFSYINNLMGWHPHEALARVNKDTNHFTVFVCPDLWQEIVNLARDTKDPATRCIPFDDAPGARVALAIAIRGKQVLVRADARLAAGEYGARGATL